MTPNQEDPWGQLRDFALGRARESLNAGDPCGAIEWLERTTRTPESLALEARARDRLAREMMVQGRFAAAATELGRLPRDSSSSRFLTEERISLLRKRRDATWDLREMAGRLGRECSLCRGRDLYTVATCRHQIYGVPSARNLHVEQFAPVIEGAYAAAAYRSGWDEQWADPMSRLLRLEKRGMERPVVRFLGLLLSSYVRHHTPLVCAVDALVPIPTSGSRALARGGCIPQVLAETTSDELAIPVREAITTSGDYDDHGLVRGKAREKALRSAWRVSKDPVLEGRTVAVVDDIITTGTTVKTAANMLLEQGVGGVFALALFHTESSRRT